MCKAQGRDEAAIHVDHIIPHRGNEKLLKDPNNLESLCTPHHNAKSAKEKHGR
jgi:5-methylcytosine-specific restriction endonuclease McrA